MRRISVIRLYGDAAEGVLISKVADFIHNTFNVSVSTYPSVLNGITPGILDTCAVRNLFQPYGAPGDTITPPVYDGYVLADTLGDMLCQAPGLFHILLLDVLVGTYDSQSMRYHANLLVASNPCIISLPGIVEGPARPKEYCIDMMCSVVTGQDEDNIRKTHAGSFLEYGDPRLQEAVHGSIMQGIFYFESGESFCADKNCRLYNAHWQSDLIHCQVECAKLCEYHQNVLANMV